jgi:simple sugar transport system substrate-binding protein
MRWVMAAHERAKQKYPKIVRISAPFETDERLETAYQKAKELLAQQPDLKRFEGSSVVDVAGIGRAVWEAGVQDTTCVMGTSCHRLPAHSWTTVRIRSESRLA